MAARENIFLLPTAANATSFRSEVICVCGQNGKLACGTGATQNLTGKGLKIHVEDSVGGTRTKYDI